jgi:zinc resistance-associated protein
MKKTSVVALAVAVGLVLLGSAAFAGWGQGYGYGPRGYGYGAASDKQVDPNAVRAFQKETLPLRDEMMVKRVEIRNEYAKEKPDQARIGTLQKEMIDLRTKIQTSAEKQGLPAAGYGPGMAGRGPGPGYGSRMMGGGGYGGQGRGGRGNCSMW